MDRKEIFMAGGVSSPENLRSHRPGPPPSARHIGAHMTYIGNTLTLRSYG